MKIMRRGIGKIKHGFAWGGVIAAVAVVAVVAIAVTLVVQANNKYAYYNDYDWYSVIEGNEHNGGLSDKVHGDIDKAVVTVVEFADYQCPGCASMNPYVEQAVEELGGDLAVIYRNYLLPYHLNGTAAASAAEAAAIQGYWEEFADLLFANQSEWENASSTERTEVFDEYFEQASNGKGDMDKFHADIASAEVSAKISFDQELGKIMGVAGTPAFFVNGQFIPWSDANGGEININGYPIGWDHRLNTSEFVQIMRDIVRFTKMEPAE